jgi:hypothetical protein
VVQISKIENLADEVRRDACPLRRSFVQRNEGDDSLTPMARLLRTQGEAGGRGAGLRLSLLLSLIWVCSKEPYTTSRVAPYWAELLGRPDPTDEGARAIRDCLHELRDRGLITLAARGSRIEIALHVETSAMATKPVPYLPPYEIEPYLSIPRSFWSSGLAGELSGAGIAMYLVSLCMTRHDDPSFFLAGEFFDSRFGISRSSRKRGLAELVKHDVLTVKVEETVNLTTFRMARRNIYTVEEAFRQVPPREVPAVPGAEQSTSSITPASMPSTDTPASASKTSRSSKTSAASSISKASKTSAASSISKASKTSKTSKTSTTSKVSETSRAGKTRSGASRHPVQD